jgi:predicted TPR repeat methyltransferase
VVLGVGLPLGEPGSVKGVQLVVEDLDTVRGDLAGRGVPVSDVAQMGPEGGLRDRRIYRDWLDREADVSGFDFSRGMLEIAQRKFPEQDLVMASLDEYLPCDDESFDVVNCSQALTRQRSGGVAP